MVEKDDDQPYHPRPGPRQGQVSLARALATPLRQLGQRRGFHDSQILTEWPIIVGERLAALCGPLRLRPARGVDGSGAQGSVLVLWVRPGTATEIAHIAPRIIERINTQLGYEAVARIIIDQAHQPPPPQPKPRPLPAPTAADQAEVAALTSVIANPALRTEMARLGLLLRQAQMRQSTQTPPFVTGSKPRQRL